MIIRISIANWEMHCSGGVVLSMMLRIEDIENGFGPPGETKHTWTSSRHSPNSSQVDDLPRNKDRPSLGLSLDPFSWSRILWSACLAFENLQLILPDVTPGQSNQQK